MLFAHPKMLFWIIPMLIILIIIMNRDFVKIDHDLRANPKFMKSRRILKVFIFLTRFLIFMLIIVLLAKPFVEIQTTERGDPKVTILIDNSSSMNAYDTSFVDQLIKKIDSEIPVTVRSISSDPLVSDTGEQIVRYLEQNANILLISDMQTTEGLSIEDSIAIAQGINATVSAIDLKSSRKDASVSIEGDDKGIANQEMSFHVNVNKLNVEEYNLAVRLDNNTIYNTVDRSDITEIKYKFDKPGTYRLEARLLGSDDDETNNVFYKTITIVNNPKILYVTATSSHLPDLLAGTYSVEKMASVPSNLSKYYAVIIEDMSAVQIGKVDELAKFVQDGNGLMVIGGMNSYDRGGYKSSEFETLLPVRIGKGDKKQGDSNIVILIDMSGSTQAYSKLDAEGHMVVVKENQALDVIKALAVDVLETLNRGNKVGVIAYAIQDPKSEDKTKFGAVPLTSGIQPLGAIIEMIKDKISRIDKQGQSLFGVGLSGAYSMLRYETGNRNVILITDGGKGIYKVVKDQGLAAAKTMADEGIKIYVVGVGRDEDGDGAPDVDEDYLKQMANIGNGLYFPAGQENKLKILFGTPEEKKQGDELSLFILNPSHFITRDLSVGATMYGFNQVVPKTVARVLVTTDSGEPALTEWRYGIGRVLSLTVFSGTSGLGQLLTGNNSKLLTRSINYLVGAPDRKEDYVIYVPDTRINEPAVIRVRSKEYPKSEIPLTKVKENEFEGTTKVNELGYVTVINKIIAVNYPKEFENLGMKKNAKSLLESTNGKLFNPTDADDIIKHIKTVSKRTKISKEFVIWPILATILLVYLFEIVCRKILENKKKV